MEESLHQLWTITIWYMGLNTTAGFFLIRWLMIIQKQMNIGEDIKKNLQKVVEDLDEIKTALKGDYDSPGLVTKHHDLDNRVSALEGKNKS